MKWLAAALVVVGVVVAWFVWPRDEPTNAPAVVTKAPKRIAAKSRPDPKSRPPATLSGSVRDPAGKPLAAAHVCVTQHRAHRCVRSGADGRYAIAGVIADPLALGASLAKYQAKRVEVPALDPNEQRTVDIVLEPGGAEITGVVEDILGGPIAHAHASADGAHTEADDKGRFTLWVRPQTAFVFVTAEADGYGPRAQPMRVPGTITIALAPASAIAGRVVDAATGTPIAGARVVTREANAVTGPDGTFALEGLAAGSYPLAASAPGKYGERDQAVDVGVGERVEAIEVRVFAARSVVATLDVHGDRAICDPAPSLADWTFTVPPPWRDDAGRYHFDAVPPSTYDVTLGCGVEVTPLVVGDDDIEVTWRVDTGGVVRGVVQAETTSRYIAVTLARVGSLRRPLYTASIEDTFEFRGVPPGRYTLSAEIDRDAPTAPETIEVVNGQTLDRTIVVPPRQKFRLTGSVVDERHRPVASGTVKIQSQFRGNSFETSINNGRFAIQLPSDAYNLDARTGDARGWASTDLRADAEVSITVESRGSAAFDDNPLERTKPSDERYELRGRVVDAQRVPVGGAIVSAVEFGYWDNADESALRTTTDAAGKFRIVSQFSQLNLHVYRIGGGSTEAVVRADQPAEIVLGAREMITGTATRPDGATATRFFVRIGESGDARTQTFDHTGGRFAVEDKHVYPLRLVAVINNLEGEPVTITPQSAKTNVVLKLPHTVTIRGRIVDSTTRAPIPNVRVHGRQSLDGWAPWFIHADQVTDADGRFTMRELPPGRVMLEVLPSLDTWSTQTFNITVPQASGDIDEFALARARR